MTRSQDPIAPNDLHCLTGMDFPASEKDPK